MRNLTKLVATAALGVAMSATFSAPTYAFTDNVKEASSYFFDCLAKLGTDDTCGGPHEMYTGTNSIYGGAGSSGYEDPQCGWCYHLVTTPNGSYCERDYKSSYKKFHKKNHRNHDRSSVN